MPYAICVACEGDTDRAVARRLANAAGFDVVAEQVTGGKQPLLARLPALRHAAESIPWLILLDLDRDADCAPPYVARLAPERSDHLCLRVAVRAVESWLLADRAGLSSYLGVPRNRLPQQPEEESDPVLSLVQAARRSKRPAIREGIPPREGSGRKKGPEYVPLLEQFVRERWDPEAAAEHCPSLSGAIACLGRLAARAHP